MLNRVLLSSSVANVLGGSVLFLTWAVNWAWDPDRHVPLVVLAIGGAMAIQGLYSIGYSLGWWNPWKEIAAGAMLAGQLISGCVGLALLVAGIAHNSSTGDTEMVPVLAGILISGNALVALALLVTSGNLSAGGFDSHNGSVLL